MRTSLNDIRQTERYLQGQLSPEDRLVFEARLMLSPFLRTNLFFQKKVYELVKFYHRKKLKEEIDTVQHSLFNDPEKVVFQQTVYRIFKK